MTAQARPIIGVFNDRRQAQQALRDLRQAGFTENQLGLIAQAATEQLPEGAGSEVEEGMVAGAATGATMGSLWAIAIAAGILPAIGPVIAGGILASILASAASGAAVGGVVGMLLGLGLSEEEAGHYEQELKSGRTLVTVQPDGRADEAVALLQNREATVLLRKADDGGYVGVDEWRGGGPSLPSTPPPLPQAASSRPVNLP